MAKNMPTSGYQKILDQNIVYIKVEKICKTNSFSMDTKLPTSNKKLPAIAI
jgi:hypothetical protein